MSLLLLSYQQILDQGDDRLVARPLHRPEGLQRVHHRNTVAAHALTLGDGRLVLEAFQAEIDDRIQQILLDLVATFAGRRETQHRHGLVMATETLAVLRVVRHPGLDAVEASIDGRLHPYVREFRGRHNRRKNDPDEQRDQVFHRRLRLRQSSVQVVPFRVVNPGVIQKWRFEAVAHFAARRSRLI